ncbi:hypothetical protein ACHAXA_011409 [Cyclostephanos tholiformis]|uniref:Uncharacterized protein n=1 Tax=Cyclostephanos tholiformis TaxID=382380 RepID=A0ABD3RV56_9STRA
MSAHTALVVRDDDRPDEGGAAAAPPSSSSSSSFSSSSPIVLDALPYVESLDPNYERYALSLIEEELSRIVVPSGGDGKTGNHPSLDRILSASRRTDDFAARAPLAAAAYEELVSRRRAGGEGGDDGGGHDASYLDRADAMMADFDLESIMSATTDDESTSSRLRACIAAAKVRLESERLRHVNLELHRQFETPARYAEYANLLERDFLNPTKSSVERQRRVVDGINGTRMEEQTLAMRKLDGVARRRDVLIERNHRLGKALGLLEEEVEALRKEADAVVPPTDNGNLNGGETTTTTATTTTTIMEVAEVTMEN